MHHRKPGVSCGVSVVIGIRITLMVKGQKVSTFLLVQIGHKFQVFKKLVRDGSHPVGRMFHLREHEGSSLTPSDGADLEFLSVV